MSEWAARLAPGDRVESDFGQRGTVTEWDDKFKLAWVEWDHLPKGTPPVFEVPECLRKLTLLEIIAEKATGR